MAPAKTTKRGGSRFGFIGDIISELKKVVWLSRREALYLTTMVLIVAIAVGLVLGTLDYAFAALVNNVLIGG